MDFWDSQRCGRASVFTTVGNWQQSWRQVTFRGETYHWSKHYEFLKFIDLPGRTPQKFELALSSSSYDPDVAGLLERHGWQLRDALEFSSDPDTYRGLHRRVTRGVHRRKRSKRPVAQRLV